MECENCGELIYEEYEFCPECGMKIQEKTDISGILGRLTSGTGKEVWAKSLAIILFSWGIINLVFTSPLWGGILIFFAVLIYASRNSMVIYAFGGVWLIFAFIQLITGVTYNQNIGSSSLNSKGYMLIIVSIINFFFAGYSIYKNRMVNDGEKQEGGN
jgi:hypothetical protein